MIQEHLQPATQNAASGIGSYMIHYDLMLEHEDVLKTWRLPKSPEQTPQTAEHIGDHRKMYLDYEGEISGNRGFVKIWDKGEYSARVWSNNSIEIELMGHKLLGNFQLSLTKEPLWDYSKV